MALNAGDLMFVGFDADNDDAAMVATTDIAAGEVIYFTDKEWDGTQFNAGEQIIEWTVPAGGIPQGTVITIDITSGPPDATIDFGGTVNHLTGGSNLAGRNEMFWAVQGTIDVNGDLIPSDFIGVIANEADGNNNQTPNLTGTGLTTSNGAIIIDGDEDYMEFTADGALSDPVERQDLIDAISDLNNWTTADGGGNNNPNPGGGFDVVIPEVVCFTAGTKIETPNGTRTVEDLRVGDLVLTQDSGLQTIRWIGRKKLTATQMKRHPHLRPVLVRKDTFGPNCPDADLYVSPQHRLLLSGHNVCLITGTREILATAKSLLNDTSIIQPRTCEDVTYVHILFDKHELVLANGTAAESFYPAHFGLGTLEDRSRTELFEIFPELAVQPDNFGQAARPLAKTAEGVLLAHLPTGQTIQH